MRGGKPTRPHGQIRQSQVVTTFGPGAMVDLPRAAVLVAGLDHWKKGKQVFEERLSARLSAILGRSVELFAPPPTPDEPSEGAKGIAAWQFPEWFVAQYEEAHGPFRRRRLLHLQELDRGKYKAPDKKWKPVVPVRFVQACVRGHIADVDWFGFVHEYKGSCRRHLWLEERGTSGDIADVWIACDCGAERSLARATQLHETPLGHCHGKRPWLGPGAPEKCGGEEGKAQPNRLLVRTATNAYFPQVLSVISIPDADEALRRAVDSLWEDYLKTADSPDDIAFYRRKNERVREVLEDFSDETTFAEVQRRRGETPTVRKTIKQAEVEVLLSSQDEIGDDQPDGTFYARTMSMPTPRPPVLANVERIVLVHRLREVVAQVGFTRFEAAMPDVEGELNLDVERAPLAREASWLPAIENRGEGIFFAFRRDAIERWLQRPAVQNRGAQLSAGFERWKEGHPGATAKVPGLPYIMLHSLAHLLITAVSLECGYAASSIRERVYAMDAGHGILLYTGTPDSEGTLGGLVQVGRRIATHFATALEMGRLCSNDPVCAQHRPGDLEGRYLSGAACHGCLLIAEPSCERRNDFLDRALVVPTVEGLGAEFFEDVP